MNKLKKLEEIYEEANKNVRLACVEELKKIGKELKALGWDSKPLYPFSKEDCRENYEDDIEEYIEERLEDEDDYEELYEEAFESYWYCYVNDNTVQFMDQYSHSYLGYEFIITECGEIVSTKANLHVDDIDFDNPYFDVRQNVNIDNTELSTITFLIETAWRKINKLKQEMSNQKD